MNTKKKTSPATQAEPSYIRAKEAARILGVSVTTVWNWATDKLNEGFPRPIRISDRVTVFPKNEIVAFAESKRAA